MSRGLRARVGARPQPRLDPVHVHEHEARRIPDLVGEGAIAVGAALVERDVGAGRGHRRQREARRVRAEALDDLQRIDHVALGLRHLLPLGIAHQRVDVDLPERHAVVLLVRLSRWPS